MVYPAKAPQPLAQHANFFVLPMGIDFPLIA